MALLVRPGGHVLGVEKIPELALRSMTSIAACSSQLRSDTACWQVRVGNVLDGERRAHRNTLRLACARQALQLSRPDGARAQ